MNWIVSIKDYALVLICTIRLHTLMMSSFSSTVPGLQQLINTCSKYSLRWRFKFGLKKNQCLIPVYYINRYDKKLTFYLGNNQIHNSDSIDILDVIFIAITDFKQHVDNRINKYRNSSYSLSDIGMCYLGVMSDTKSDLFRSICQPTLVYVYLDVVNITINMGGNVKIQKVINEKCIWYYQTFTSYAIVTSIRYIFC